ncbi:MAG TPA: TlpA disulfide reductase family protein [Gemmatimonadota bacterium]|nr:TlpA disulfide reductase family protein [Gemmatimonadota bacterium]
MWKKALIPALVTAPIIAFLYYGMQRDVRNIESPLPGHAAFEFAAPTLDGDTISLAELSGKVVVLNFWASWCIACIDEHRIFIDAERFYADQDFQMLGVVYQDGPENARRWMRQRGGNWPSLIDRNSRIAIDYGVYGVPETYFISRDGRIAYKQIGPVSGPTMRHWVDSLLAETPGTQVTAGEVPEGRSAGHSSETPPAGAQSESGGSQP